MLIWRDRCCRTRERGVDGIDPSKSKGGSLFTRALTNRAQERTRNENSLESRSNDRRISYKYKQSIARVSFTIEYLRTNEPIRGWSKGSQRQRGGQATNQGEAQVNSEYEEPQVTNHKGVVIKQEPV